MTLPYSEELNIGYLSRVFDKTSNCYKFFWFLALLEKIDGRRLSFTYDELLNEMIASAWYMVTEYHLHLGPIGGTDNLEEVVKDIQRYYGFSSTEKRNKIIAFLESSDDKRITKRKNTLIEYVPYRLQTPFYEEKISESEWKDLENTLEKINTKKRQSRLIYYFTAIADMQSVITVDEKWEQYLYKNKEILKSWAQFNLIKYLQKRNPGVSGIAEKIEAPTSRNLNDIRKYWRLIISRDLSIRDIYGDYELTDEKISVDHFVPWQFVAHDELWNLHPTTVSINSSKSNNLPMWDKYFEKLSILEFKAYDLIFSDDDVKKRFEDVASFHLNDSNVRNSLYCEGLDRPEFQSRLEKIIKPLYESARNCGFKEWEYEKTIKI